LGIDMADVKDGWITAQNDSVSVVLPSVKLLDENFLDEAATRAFYETGKWTQQARKQLSEKARRKMLNRCMTKANLETARQNAVEQFRQMLASLGFKHVQVKVTPTVKTRKRK
ncbi:MAG: DUF4230 domain-containing protein, partial [Prevotella sp.]|nr:DUF4230 domain-containing protein [Prevotella sp.]